jgi:hypothetical protein
MFEEDFLQSIEEVICGNFLEFKIQYKTKISPSNLEGFSDLSPMNFALGIL